MCNILEWLMMVMNTMLLSLVVPHTDESEQTVTVSQWCCSARFSFISPAWDLFHRKNITVDRICPCTMYMCTMIQRYLRPLNSHWDLIQLAAVFAKHGVMVRAVSAQFWPFGVFYFTLFFILVLPAFVVCHHSWLFVAYSLSFSIPRSCSLISSLCSLVLRCLSCVFSFTPACVVSLVLFTCALCLPAVSSP